MVLLYWQCVENYSHIEKLDNFPESGFMVDGRLINCTFLVHNSINFDKDAMQPQPIFNIWINYSISAVATGFQSSFVSNLASSLSSLRMASRQSPFH